MTTANSKITALETNQVVNIVTDEIVKTNTKVDGKDVYVKRINLGNFPNKGSNDNIATNLLVTSVTVVQLKGIAYSNNATHDMYPLPRVNSDNVNWQITLGLVSKNGYHYILVQDTHDFSAYTGYAEIYFTYNS